MTGEQALAYVGERYSLRRGDFDRVQRQQAWIRAILAKVRTEGVLLNPARAYEFLDAVSRSIAVDDAFTRGAMQDLLWQIKDVPSGGVTFFTVPISGTDTSADGQSIVVLVSARIRRADDGRAGGSRARLPGRALRRCRPAARCGALTLSRERAQAQVGAGTARQRSRSSRCPGRWCGPGPRWGCTDSPYGRPIPR